MQLSRRGRGNGEKPRGFFATGMHIVRRETPLGLYKGLGAVVAGIVPKMAIRFMSFEQYKGWFANKETGHTSPQGIFVAGLMAGTTEAVAVVNPMEVVKIRLQAQQHSLADPLEKPRYHNAAHALYTIIREEGFSTLYRGVALTAARQATNQAANFTAYQELRNLAKRVQHTEDLPSYETATIGLISGALGPFSNAPIDTIKTRIQKAQKVPGETALGRVMKGTFSLLTSSCQRDVCPGGCLGVLEGYHAPCGSCRPRSGRCLHDLREGQGLARADWRPRPEARRHGQEVITVPCTYVVSIAGVTQRRNSAFDPTRVEQAERPKPTTKSREPARLNGWL